MSDVFHGFTTIGFVISLGFVVGHLGLFDLTAQAVLARVAFFLGTPALLFIMLAEADLTEVFSKALLASAASVLVCVTCYVVPGRLVWRRTPSELVIGSLSASFINAGNLGIPIAAYVLGNAALVAPILLMQVLALQPVGLAILGRGAGSSAGRNVLGTMKSALGNPVTLASLAGVGLAAAHVRLPTGMADPLRLIGGMAVPAMLLAYGLSLRLGPRPGSGAPKLELAYIAFLKLAVQPMAAFAIGHYLLDLSGNALLGVTVLAALPTAQNVFIYAAHYRGATGLARDSIFLTTVLSFPVVLLISALLA